VNSERRQPVPEVFAKATACDRSGKVAVRRGENPDIDRHRPRSSQPLDPAGLDDPEQIGLDLRRRVADLVEQQTSAVGLLEPSLPSLRGAGERAAFVAEEFALDRSSTAAATSA
jgi:hypothetical protein